jgi:hypothetical protein
MLKQLLSLHHVIEQNKGKFEDFGLSGDFFIDVYRSQLYKPELYDFPLPALFVDYSMVGHGKNQPRLITMTIHIITDELPDVAGVSEQEAGLKRFTYCLLLQSILENCLFEKSTPLRFVSENIVDEPGVNYHSQVYEFEVYLEDMITDISHIFGEFERLNVYSGLMIG